MSDAATDTQSAFERLHPAVQYHVVNSLGWPGLRPLQERSVDPILAQKHALLIAPTAGGKTEAAMLPVLSRMLSEEWKGVCVLSVSYTHLDVYKRQRMLNLDGFPIVTLEQGTGTVLLDIPLLKTQFLA